MTASERQNRYRVKRRAEGDKRLSIWITKDAANSLSKVTKHLGVTQEHMIQNILLILMEHLFTHGNINPTANKPTLTN